MNLDAIPLLGMIKSRLGYLTERQRVISQNVANSDTPGYVAKDLKPFTFEAAMNSATSARAPVMTQPGHMTTALGAHGAAGSGVQAKGDTETTLDGNAVTLEDQMMKLTQARMDYDAAIGFYQKSVNLLHIAIKKPGA